MPLIRKRRIWWEPVLDATVYVVYVGKDHEIFEPIRFSWEATPGILRKEIHGKTEIVIPDEWPEFPLHPGVYHIGITCKDEVGNEGDPFVCSGLFKFVAPAAPSKAGVGPA